jgi:hypothetical protein
MQLLKVVEKYRITEKGGLESWPEIQRVLISVGVLIPMAPSAQSGALVVWE